MRKSRVRQLKEQARKNGMDGSVVIAHEYKRLKKSYNNPHYAPVTVHNPQPPGFSFLGKYKAQREKINQGYEKMLLKQLEAKAKNKPNDTL